MDNLEKRKLNFDLNLKPISQLEDLANEQFVELTKYINDNIELHVSTERMHEIRDNIDSLGSLDLNENEENFADLLIQEKHLAQEHIDKELSNKDKDLLLFLEDCGVLDVDNYDELMDVINGNLNDGILPNLIYTTDIHKIFCRHIRFIEDYINNHDDEELLLNNKLNLTSFFIFFIIENEIKCLEYNG